MVMVIWKVFFIENYQYSTEGQKFLVIILVDLSGVI